MPDQTVLYVLAGIVGVLILLGLILWGIITSLLRKLRKHDQDIHELHRQEHRPPTPEEIAAAQAAVEQRRASSRARVESVRQRAREAGERLRGSFTVTSTTTSSSGFEGLAEGLRAMNDAMRGLGTSFEQATENLRQVPQVSAHDLFEEVSEIMSRTHALTPRDIEVLHRHFPRLNFGNAPRVATPDPKAELGRRAIPPPPPKPNPTWHEHLLRDEDEEPECPPTTTTSPPTQARREKPPPTPMPSDGKKITS